MLLSYPLQWVGCKDTKNCLVSKRVQRCSDQPHTSPVMRGRSLKVYISPCTQCCVQWGPEYEWCRFMQHISPVRERWQFSLISERKLKSRECFLSSVYCLFCPPQPSTCWATGRGTWRSTRSQWKSMKTLSRRKYFLFISLLQITS